MSTIDAGQATALKSTPELRREDRRGREEIRRVADDVEGDARGEQEPRQVDRPDSKTVPPITNESKQEVADRVGQVGRRRRDTATGGVQDAVEGERRTDRGRTEAGDHAVEPVRA